MTLTGAEISTDELLANSRAAHARLGRFSMQVWTRSFSWGETKFFAVNSSVNKIVRADGGLIALVGVERRSSVNAATQQSSPDQVTRLAFRIEPGPRFLRGEWINEKNKLLDRPVTAITYQKELRPQLSNALANGHPFDEAMFGAGERRWRLNDLSRESMRIAGRENIAGHECIRLDTESATLWFDAESLLLRRFIHQSTEPGLKSGTIVDVYCDVRPLATNEVANLAPVLDDTFESKSMQWVPFLPLEQLRENIRITGRAAGLLIAAPEDQLQAQPTLPPLSPEQRAAIVTIEGDVLSGLGFYSRFRNDDYLITDVRLVTQNRWIKVRDAQGNALSFIGVFQAEGARVALLKATSAPSRLKPSASASQKQGAFLFMLCAFDKGNAVLQPAYCVSRSSAAGSYTVVHALAEYMSGGPIINVDDGSVAGVLIKSDPPKNKPPGPVMARWHAEPLFSHSKWIQIGSIPQK